MAQWAAPLRRLPDVVKACAVAQLLSFLLACTGVTSNALANAGINAPCTQATLNYALLGLTCGLLHVYNCGGVLRLSNPWYVYVALAVMDLEGNYLVTSAYQYTSITSVTLLDSATIPVVMLLSLFVFRSRFRIGHVSGAIICTAGLALLTLTDYDSSTGGSNPFWGDALVISGAAVYACCNVAQEKLLGEATSRWELLGALGTAAAFMGGAQALVLEHDQWSSPAWNLTTAAAMAGFVLSMYAFYLLVPSVLLLGSSAVLNLNLLTSDLWAAAAREALFGGFGGTAWAFGFALAAEAFGISLYAAAGPTHGHPVVVGGGGADGECGGGRGGRGGEGAEAGDDTAAALLPAGALLHGRESDDGGGACSSLLGSSMSRETSIDLPRWSPRAPGGEGGSPSRTLNPT